MTVIWILTILAALHCYCQLAEASQNVCSSFCSSLGTLQSNPGKSCDDIYQINKASRGASGNYWIETSTGVHQVYCDMELECGVRKGGWMRIADIDTSRGDNCPSGWNKYTTPAHQTFPSIDVCQPPHAGTGCFSTIFSVHNVSYTKICGKARGYQRATTDGFGLYVNGASKSINGPYVDGLSITLGNPRKHVWTYATGYSDDRNLGKLTCPCAAVGGAEPVPFVGDHYYCESGTIGLPQGAIHTDDALWDGDGCVNTNNNCCTNPSLPWFFRDFLVTQREDIEARLCSDEGYNNEATVIDQLQLYIM